jgi:hypothetical protein
MSLCPSTGIRDFPIQNNVKVNDDLILAVKESYLVSVQWAQRSDAPKVAGGGFFDEGSQHSAATNQSTLRLQGNSYVLQSVQICKPQHVGFVRDVDKPLIQAELILCFSGNGSGAEKYVLFCIPILNKPTTSPNVYITAIKNGRLPGGPISVGSIMPEKQGFLCYSTCLNQVQSGKSVATQARVFVFYEGLFFDVGGVNPINVQLPDNITPTTMAVPFTLQNDIDFKNFLRSSDLKTGKGDAALNQRVDATSAYKCMPLNPDTQIKDGKIVVDTQKGELLSQVLQERTTDLSAEAPQGGLTPGDIQKVIAIAFGIGFGLLILSLLAYFVSIYSTGEGSFPEGDVISIPEWMSNIGPSIAIAVIGFIVGAIVIGLIKK